jgi:hypothetical protein
VRIPKVKLIAIYVAVLNVGNSISAGIILTTQEGCKVDRENIKVNQYCNNYVGIVNNYLSPKTYSINNHNIDYLEIYFLNSVG